MNKNTKLLFLHKILYEVYFYGAITIPFFVSKGYTTSTALTFASVYMITGMIMEIPTGMVGDRYGHRKSVILGALGIGAGLFGLVLIDNLLIDMFFVFVFATGSSLTTGSDIALLRSVSNNFERDNRTFEYLKSIMLLVSFGAAGFIVKYLGVDIAIGLSALLAIVCAIPLLLIKQSNNAAKKTRSVSASQQLMQLPSALKHVSGGFYLLLLAGVIGGILFSAKEIISTFNLEYNVDITIIGLLAGLAMLGRIIGTAIEKRIKATYVPLVVLLIAVIGLTSFIEINTTVGIAFMLLATVAAQMPFYRLRYQLSSQAPDSHVATLGSALTLSGRLAAAGVILLTGLFTNAGYFYATFVTLAAILLVVGLPMATSIQKASKIK